MGQGSLPPAVAEGTLEASPFAQIVAHALDRRLTGTLLLEAPDGAVASAVFREGWPYKAKTQEAHYLGMVLRTLGLIDDGAFNASLARVAREKRLQGELLLEMGALTPEGLARGLRAQLVEQLEPLFALPGATTYRFFENYDALAHWGGREIVPADPLALIWSGLVRSPPWPQVNSVLARIDAPTLVRFTPRADLSRFRFEKRLVDLVELLRSHPLSLDGMRATTLADANEVKLLVYLMLLTKQAVFVAPEPARPKPPTPSRPPPHYIHLTPAKGIPATRFPLPGDPKVSQIPPRMPSAAPRASTPPRGSSMPPRRTPSNPPRASAPPPNVVLTPELAAFRQKIIDRIGTIQSETYFEVLGVSQDATAADVQAAFIALAKVWHPDRLAPQLFDVKDLSVRIFARMNDARSTLTTADLRAEYITQLSRPARPDPRHHLEGVNAAVEMQKAEVYLKRRDFVLAEQHVQRARDADPANSDSLALLTWITLEREGFTAATLPDHIETLTNAIKMNDRCERAYYYRAQLYKRVLQHPKAYNDFRKAAELNPNNIDAAREAYLYRKRGV